MNRIVLWTVATLFPVVTVVAGPLADRLPGQSAMYIEWCGYDQMKAAAGDTPFGQLLATPDMQRFIDEISRVATLTIRKEAARDGEADIFDDAISLVKSVWHQRMAIDLIGVTMSERGPAPEAVLAIDFDGDSGAAQTFVATLEKLLGRTPIGTGVEEEIDGKKLKSIMVPFVAMVRYGVVDDVFLVMVGTETPVKVFNAMKGDHPTVSQDQHYIAAMKKIGTKSRNNLLLYHIDTATILHQARAFWSVMSQAETFPPMVENAIAAASLDRLKSLTAVLQVDGDRFRQSTFIALPPEDGRPKWMHQQPVTDKQLKMIPADAVFAKAANFKLVDLYDGIVHVINAVGPMADGPFTNGLAQIEGQLGLRIRDDILAKFDGGWVVYISPDAGGLVITGATMMIQTSEPDAIEGLVTRLIRAIDEEIRDVSITVRERTHGGHTIRYLAFSGEPIPVAPAWSVHGEYLVLGLYPQIVSAALDHLSANNAKSILDNPDFQRGRKRLPSNASSVVYTDTKAIMTDIYRLALPLATMAAAEAQTQGVDLPPDLFPSARVFTAGLYGDVATYSSDADGALITTSGPMPLEMAGVAIPMTVGSAASVLVPSLTRARGIAKRTVSLRNVKGIVTGCQAYASSHDDRFPPSLKALVDEDMIQRKMLRSPLEQQDRTSYVYLGKDVNINRIPAPHDTIVIYEHPENHDRKGTVAAFADGHAKWVTMGRFEELLEESKKALNQARLP